MALAASKIASAKNLFLQYCCNYVPSSGTYTMAILRVLGFAAAITLIGILLGFYFLTQKGRMPPNAAAESAFAPNQIN